MRLRSRLVGKCCASDSTSMRLAFQVQPSVGVETARPWRDAMKLLQLGSLSLSLSWSSSVFIINTTENIKPFSQNICAIDTVPKVIQFRQRQEAVLRAVEFSFCNRQIDGYTTYPMWSISFRNSTLFSSKVKTLFHLSIWRCQQMQLVLWSRLRW